MLQILVPWKVFVISSLEQVPDLFCSVRSLSRYRRGLRLLAFGYFYISPKEKRDDGP